MPANPILSSPITKSTFNFKFCILMQILSHASAWMGGGGGGEEGLRISNCTLYSPAGAACMTANGLSRTYMNTDCTMNGLTSSVHYERPHKLCPLFTNLLVYSPINQHKCLPTCQTAQVCQPNCQTAQVYLPPVKKHKYVNPPVK